MREAYGWKNEDCLWAGTALRGGIAGQQEGPCGAVSGSALVLGLRHRYLGNDKEKAGQAREAVNKEAAELAGSFKEKFGSITCIGLLGVDFTDEAAVQKARDEGIFNNKCPGHVRYAIEKLYELEEKRL